MVSTGSTDGAGQPVGSEGSTDGPEQPVGTEQPVGDKRSTEGTGQPGRYQRSTSGMVGALIVTLLVIFAFVAFRALNRSDLDVKPEKVDYLSQVGYAQEAGARPVYPARLPRGWYATMVTFSPADRSALELSMLTADGQYVGFVESATSPPELLTTYVDPHPVSGGPVTVDGSVVSRWEAWTDAGGDSALVAQRRHGSSEESLLVFGTVSRAQLEDLAASLTTARVAG